MRILFLREPTGAWRSLTIDDSNKVERGREGEIYESSTGEVALKLFINAEPTYLRAKQSKIRAMLEDRFISYFIEEREYPDFAWPICTIHTAQTEESFVGFGMRKLVNYRPLDFLFSSTDSASKKFDDLQRVLICSYLSHLFAVCHARNVIVGDVKPDNIYVHAEGHHVALIDCDSFQISRNGTKFTTDVGTREYASPRLIQISNNNGQSLNLNGIPREVGDDTFALAIICFRLLMSGYHPFHTTQAEANKGNVFENIRDRVFPYVEGSKKPPKHAPAAKYETLPFEVRSLFENAFRRAEYVSAIRWRDAFYSYAQQLEQRPIRPVLTVVEQAQPMPIPTLGSRSPPMGFWARVWHYLAGT